MDRKKPDIRTQKTRKAIVSAFIQLLKQEKYDNITVQDIIKKANVGRATFYNHFETKDTLLNEVQTHILSEFTDCMTPQDADSFIPVAKIIRHLDEHRFILKTLTAPGKNDFFIQQLNLAIKNFLKTKAVESEIPLDLLASYYSSNFITLLKWWMRHKSSCTPEDMEKIWNILIKQPPL